MCIRDRVYYVNREKSVIATTFGKKPLTDGLRINGAHIDSPRLDLKPNPVYEKEDIAYFKTHYYGGIRKYQWGTIPLAMHGVIVKKDGEKVEISIGEKEGDPVFCVTDLLPHLTAKQNDRKLAEGIKGEELNIVVGSVPFLSLIHIYQGVPDHLQHRQRRGKIFRHHSGAVYGALPGAVRPQHHGASQRPKRGALGHYL